jgi:hypothetical protein
MSPSDRVVTILSGAARRLLAALAQADAYAAVDPTRPGTVLVRRERGGISLGAGAFKLDAAEELARHDLVCSGESQSGRRLFRIAEPGRAYLSRGWAGGDSGFQAQHQERFAATTDVDGERSRVTVDAGESPLDWLRRRKDRNGDPLVDEACYEAGERLRRELTMAAMLPTVTSRWDPAGGTSGKRARDPADATDAAIAARQRVTAAFRAVGADLADLLIDVCGFLKGLETIERERGWPQRSGKIVVNLALARLADHYGLERAARGPAHSRGIRAWRAALIEAEGGV